MSRKRSRYEAALRAALRATLGIHRLPPGTKIELRASEDTHHHATGYRNGRMELYYEIPGKRLKP